MIPENIKPFRGDPNLKKHGSTINWTQELVAEFIRCKEDIIYFSEKYIKIVTEDGLVPIVLRDYQKELILSMQEHRATYALQCRQSGKTEALRCFALHYIIFNDQKTMAILANKGATAIEILGKIQIAYRHLPAWLQMGVTEWNKGSFVLENGSRILASATSSDAIRGYTIQCLALDEFAFIDNFEEFYASVLPTIIAGKETKIVVCTTPRGLNHAYKFWMDAQQGTNMFNPIFVPWWRVPGRDAAWKEETLKLMGGNIEKFSQEQDCEFLGSSGTLIGTAALKSLASANPIAQHDGLSIYDEKRGNHQYTIICDVSRGKGLDYSAFSVIDITSMPYRQVAVFRNNMVTPLDYASIIYRTARAYNNASVLVEINDTGGQVADSLFYDYEYENIIYTGNAGARGKKITAGFGKKKADLDRGIRTTKTVKSIGCSMLKLLIEQQQLIITDQNTIYELSRFSKKGPSYAAETGATDDLVMGLVLFAWMTDQQYFKELTDIETLKTLRDLTEEEMELHLTPFGFIIDGQEDTFDDDGILNLTDNPGHEDFRYF